VNQRLALFLFLSTFFENYWLFNKASHVPFGSRASSFCSSAPATRQMASAIPCTPYGIGKNMGVEYVGDLRDSLMHGNGTLTNTCGGFRWTSYKGEFEKNKANGQGVLIRSSHLVEEYSNLMRHVTENIRPKRI
jgi:hypothetical protein